MRIWKEIWDYAKMIIIVVVIVTLVNSVVLINAKNSFRINGKKPL